MGSPPWEADGMDHHTSPLLPPRGEMGSPSHREANALRKKRGASVSYYTKSVLEDAEGQLLCCV